MDMARPPHEGIRIPYLFTSLFACTRLVGLSVNTLLVVDVVYCRLMSRFLFAHADPEYQRALFKAARPIAIPARVRSISWSSGFGYGAVMVHPQPHPTCPD